MQRPQPFWHQGLVSWKTIFSTDLDWWGKKENLVWFRYDLSALYLLCILFLLYCISSTSDLQALDPGGWRPLG